MKKGRNGKSGKKTTDNAADMNVPDMPEKESADAGKPLSSPASATLVGPFEALPELPVEGDQDGASVKEKTEGEKKVAKGAAQVETDADDTEAVGADVQPADDFDDEDNGYLSDASDEHLEPDSLNSILALKRFSLTLLKELLSSEVLLTTTYQDLSPMYFSGERYGRLQVTFHQVRDANFVWSQVIRHECVNGDFIDLTWQHPEDARFLRERVLNPTAKEVVIKGVPAEISAELIRRLLVVSKLVIRGKTLCSFFPTAAALKASDLLKSIMRDPAIILTSTGGAREEWVCVQSACEKAQGSRFEQASAHIASAHHKGGLRKEGSATRASVFSQKLQAFKKEFITKPAKEERKRETATRLHLTNEVERLRARVSRYPHCQRTGRILLRKEELLEAYEKSHKEKLQTWAGVEAELDGEVVSGILSAQIKTRKAMTAIREVSRNGTVLTWVKEVLSAATDHFREAFGCSGGGAVPGTDDRPMLRRLGEESRRSLSAPWTEEEVRKAVRELAPGKSPGADGLPKELFDYNWDLLGPILMDLVGRFTRGDDLPQNITTAVTILLHKKGDKGDLGNYRPITLLSTVYKIVAKVMASRLKKVLHEVISEDQYGFIPDRQLADAVAVVADAIEAGANGNEDWFLLMIDFQKAFDSISRDFLFSTLRKLGLPEEFVSWTEGLHREAGTCLHINGWTGEKVAVEKGVRQGCPLAPYLFLCAVEPLCQEGGRKEGRG
ncbi:unnamed protein product [Closterium sp. Yama58-4]|nr:unnamed protein product [Closterium sp. Yama58-4]